MIERYSPPPVRTRAPRSTASATSRSTLSRAASLISGPSWAPSVSPSATVTAAIGVWFLAGASEGWYGGRLAMPLRFAMGAAALCMLHPGSISDLVGLGIGSDATVGDVGEVEEFGFLGSQPGGF